MSKSLPPSYPVISYEVAKADGLSSSFIRTIARSLDRISRDYFQKSLKGNFESKFKDSWKETRSSLIETSRVAQQNSYRLRNLAIRLKKEGL